MTAALAVDAPRFGQSEQLYELRRKIAEVSGRMSRDHPDSPRATALLADPECLLPIPESLVELLPRALPSGSVVVISGARSLTLGVVAAVTAGGGHAAVVGQPDIGLLAAVEMGADLTRLAVVPDPGADPIEIAAVLMDGMDLVVLDLRGRSAPMSRTRALTARARSKSCTLLVSGGEWQGAKMRLHAVVSGYELTGAAGFGRIGKVQLAIAGRTSTYGSVLREKRATSPRSG